MQENHVKPMNLVTEGKESSCLSMNQRTLQNSREHVASKIKISFDRDYGGLTPA
jgi:hypothetical protein